tara:strand:+ start:99 stop:311 length:213 start_codon:yes stop_codon:yes gene_type:complete
MLKVTDKDYVNYSLFNGLYKKLKQKYRKNKINSDDNLNITRTITEMKPISKYNLNKIYSSSTNNMLNYKY